MAVTPVMAVMAVMAA
jgi:hypothetical protein